MTAPEAFGEETLIRAAGALLWRHSPRGREIAVIYRERHDDWTLPKGKLRDGERWDVAARREVREETRCDGTLGPFAGTSVYTTKDGPKLVLFWHMFLSREREFRPGDEAKKLEWLTVKEALARLTYVNDRRLVTANAHAPVAAQSSWQQAWPWWRRFWGGDPVRLAGNITVFRSELEFLIRRATDKGRPTEPWASETSRLLGQAEEALVRKDMEFGWLCFYGAACMSVHGLDRQDLDACARMIRHEADEKLSSWRKEAVKDLIPMGATADDRQGDLCASKVCRALRIVFEHHGNVHRRGRMSRTQLLLLAGLGALALGAWLLWVAPSVLPAPDALVPNRALVLSLCLWGVMGAAVSGIIGHATGSARVRIPELRGLLWWSVARLGVGFIAGPAVYFFVSAGLLGDAQPMALEVAFAIAFAAGFSERLVVRAAGTV